MLVWMERSSKKELLLYIEEQDKTLQKYKSRLHDVVGSYKNVLKEKETLESTIQAITGSNIQTPSGDSVSIKYDDNSSSIASDISDAEDANVIDSLKLNLASLVAEKTRTENELKTDRKKLLKEKDELEDQLHQCEEGFEVERRRYESIIQEMKKQIRDHQRDREKEQEDHVLMLKELQSLVADERSAKEKLEQQAENLKFALEKLPDKRFEYETRIIELQSELAAAKSELHAVNEEKRDMPSVLLHLQQEMTDMKYQNFEVVQNEVRRANEAENKLKAIAEVNEERSANMELRLSELSQMVGNYDKLRQQDKMAIQKLKDRVVQLDQENMTLAKAVAHTERKSDIDDNYSTYDVYSLIDKINKLKSSLRLAYQNAKKSNSLSEFVNEALKDDDGYLHSACQKEIIQLKEEIEDYKELLQSSQTEKSTDKESIGEIKTLREQISSLQEELRSCKHELDLAEERFLKCQENFQHCMEDLRSKHTQGKIIQQSEFKMKIFELENQLQKQRERSLKTIEDKDGEISYLKSTYLPLIEEKIQLERKMSEPVPKSRHSSKSSIDNEDLSQLTGSAIVAKQGGTGVLYYTQEIARNKVEIANLRRAHKQTESALRELQQATSLKEEKAQNEIENLLAQLGRQKDSQKGINMEYLKNVFFRFLQSSDPTFKSHTVNAIAKILHFTPRELQQIKSKYYY